MSSLQQKIDFAAIFRVTNANPNGDPLNGNRPRLDYSSLGEMSDVAIKRKLRDRLLERWINDGRDEADGNSIFVQSDDRKADEAKSLRERAEAGLGKDLGGTETVQKACARWLDVRAFGQLFALKSSGKSKKKDAEVGGGDTGVSVGIRGPVTVQSAFSLAPVEVSSIQITKSVSGEGDGSKRGSDTMGMKHRVDSGVYVFFGSMNPQLAERTGFSDADAEAIKTVLPRLFENDESAARPAGSMQVLNVVWWQHASKAGQYSAARVHNSLRQRLRPDGSFDAQELTASLPGLEPEIIEGF